MSDIRVIVCGSKGKVGSILAVAVDAEDGLQLAAGVDLGDNLEDALHSGADVIVDFTQADAAIENAMSAISHGVAPVIGTTGIPAEKADAIAAAAGERGIGGAIIPNFAIGAVLMMRLSEIASPYFEAVEVIEAHHDTKLDAPSGTALATARRLNAARAEGPFSVNHPEKVTLEGTRGGVEGTVAVHSLRLPGLVADQEVIFGGRGQTLTIAHRTTSREAFVPGVLATVRAVVAQKRFFRSLDEVLGL